jgi:glycosyltransferase involved in cell wall biosynthesis
MKILQIISSGGMYGAESVILNLAHALSEAAHLSFLGVFANASNPNLQLYEKAVHEGIDSCLIPCKAQVDHAAIVRIRELAVRTGADVLHAHGYKADIYAYLAFRNRGLPLLSTCHNWLDEDWRVHLYGVADRYVLRRFTRVVAVSHEVKERLLRAGVPPERVTLIPNGIDVRPFEVTRPLVGTEWGEQRPPVIGQVGRLSWEKGTDIFLHAAAEVLHTFPNASFVVAGDGPERTSLERLVDDLKIRRSVSLLGRRDDMPSVYRSFDMMVSSSRQEGLPVAILEGMASGLPIIATAVGEVPKLVRNDDTGVLLLPGDSGPLASAIMGLLGDRERCKRLGSAARQLISRDYSAQKMTAEYLRVYADALTLTQTKHARRTQHQESPIGGTK